MGAVVGSAGERVASSPRARAAGSSRARVLASAVGPSVQPLAGGFADPAAEPYRSLADLVAAMEGLAAAVVRHDAPALEAATATATDLVARIERLAADGLGTPGSAADERLLGRLADRLESSARLAAQLIERAWSSEAAALQLLARCLGGRMDGETYRPGRPAGPDGPLRGEPHVLERRA
ncbi:MAG TPA: hypothetical protein VNO86_09325 [Candidatus Binatia bacterium]|nr:hypothetical protein [Candidatus Binatia bacterium]